MTAIKPEGPIRGKGKPPKMSTEELVKRADGRAPKYMEEVLGMAQGRMSAYLRGRESLPDRWADPVRARFPLPEADRFEEGRIMGYNQAKSDLAVELGRLRP